MCRRRRKQGAISLADTYFAGLAVNEACVGKYKYVGKQAGKQVPKEARSEAGRAGMHAGSSQH